MQPHRAAGTANTGPEGAARLDAPLSQAPRDSRTPLNWQPHCSLRSWAHDAMEGKKLHVAPMLAVTDAHFRQLCRLLSRQAVLWTEMVHADAILHNGARLLPFDAVQQPCVLQLGGSLPETLARAAAIGAAEYGYTEVNLNVRRPRGATATQHTAGSASRAALTRGG